jgi:carbamoyl-phosphate synthase large subunit
VGGVEINVVGMGDGHGGLVGAVGVKKAWVTELGKMWTGITVRHPATLAAAEAFVRMSGWRGPFELECMTRGDEVDLIEINPRFPAWVYLATGVGVNLPAALVRGLAGLPVKAAEEYATGRLFVRYSYDLVTDMSRLQQMVTQGGAP